MTNNDTNKALKKISKRAQKINKETGNANDDLLGTYLDHLDQILDLGWDYALGASNEIDHALLPELCRKQRSEVISDLEMDLGNCATRYRAAPEGSQEEKESIKSYHETFDGLLRISGKIKGLDPDSELPDELMPKVYVDYWL